MDLKRADVVSLLDDVSAELQCAFAAACAERLLPWYRQIVVDSGRLSTGLELVWACAESATIDAVSLQPALAECEVEMARAVSHPRWGWVARDAAIATAYAVKSALGGGAADAGWAAATIQDSAFQYIVSMQLAGVTGPVTFTRAMLDRATAHELLQSEFAREHADIDDLKRMSKIAGPSRTLALHELRNRSVRDSAFFFGAPAEAAV